MTRVIRVSSTGYGVLHPCIIRMSHRGGHRAFDRVSYSAAVALLPNAGLRWNRATRVRRATGAHAGKSAEDFDEDVSEVLAEVAFPLKEELTALTLGSIYNQ